MREIKGIRYLCVCVLGMLLLSACVYEKDSTSIRNSENGEKLHDDVEAGTIRQIIILGNARSVVIKQSENNNFEFYNYDMDMDHMYEVRCNEEDGILTISIIMKNAEDDNDVLGSPTIYIPQKEFQKIEMTGQFKQVHVDTMNSDVFVHTDHALVALELKAERLNHNITVSASDKAVFRGVSVYMDHLPKNIRMNIHTVSGGVIYDPQHMLKQNSFTLGSGEPLIHIQNTEEVDLYIEET